MKRGGGSLQNGSEIAKLKKCREGRGCAAEGSTCKKEFISRGGGDLRKKKRQGRVRGQLNTRPKPKKEEERHSVIKEYGGLGKGEGGIQKLEASRTQKDPTIKSPGGEILAVSRGGRATGVREPKVTKKETPTILT